MKHKLTQQDVDKMKAEIEHRKVEVRPELLEHVKEARAHGDLSENFEYHAAKKEKNRNLRFADDSTPIPNQVVSFIESISTVKQYDSSIFRRDAEKILIPKNFDLFHNPEKSLLFINAATKLIARGKSKSYLFNYKKNNF